MLLYLHTVLDANATIFHLASRSFLFASEFEEVAEGWQVPRGGLGRIDLTSSLLLTTH